MRILFVVNSYFSQGNGLDESARRTVEALRAAGQEVRVLSGKNFENPDGPQPDYPMEKYEIANCAQALIAMFQKAIEENKTYSDITPMPANNPRKRTLHYKHSA